MSGVKLKVIIRCAEMRKQPVRIGIIGLLITFFLLISGKISAQSVSIKVDRGSGGVSIGLDSKDIAWGMGLYLEGPGFQIPQNEYNQQYFKNIEVDGFDKTTYLIVGEVAGKFDFVQRARILSNCVILDYELTAKTEVTTYEIGIRGNVAPPGAYSETEFFSETTKHRFSDTYQNSISLSGKEYIGWRYPDGVVVKVFSKDKTLDHFAVTDGRVWGISLTFSGYTPEGKGKTLHEGDTLKFRMDIQF